MARFFMLLLGLAISTVAIAQVPFPDGFVTRDMPTNGATIHVRTAARDLRSSCSMVMARLATCGHRSQPNWPGIIW